MFVSPKLLERILLSGDDGADVRVTVSWCSPSSAEVDSKSTMAAGEMVVENFALSVSSRSGTNSSIFVCCLFFLLFWRQMRDEMLHNKLSWKRKSFSNPANG